MTTTDYHCDNDGIATITINNPRRRNAMTFPMIEQLYENLKIAETEARVIILTGAENRIKVTTKEGVIGFFDGEGRWIEGELYEADPELCIWLAAKRIDASHRLS